MSISTTHSKVRAVRQGDKDFNIVDGAIMYPRAMLHVLPDCPPTVRHTIAWAVDNGYLKCVANMYDSERVWEILNGQ